MIRTRVRGRPLDRFRGQIAGVGSTSGVRLVVGRWRESPLGSFADVMVAEPSGRRILLAPDDRVADYVATTYRFDEVVVGPVHVDPVHDGGTTEGALPGWRVTAPGLEVTLSVGARTALGRVLRLLPEGLATSPAWSAVTDPVARLVLRGVRTRGSAGGGRREHYGATDLRRVVAVAGTWRGATLGALAPVAPEPGFGFGSTPRTPSVTTLVTTVVRAAPADVS